MVIAPGFHGTCVVHPHLAGTKQGLVTGDLVVFCPARGARGADRKAAKRSVGQTSQVERVVVVGRHTLMPSRSHRIDDKLDRLMARAKELQVDTETYGASYPICLSCASPQSLGTILTPLWRSHRFRVSHQLAIGLAGQLCGGESISVAFGFVIPTAS